jgi:hypothetical protein
MTFEYIDEDETSIDYGIIYRCGLRNIAYPI